MSNENVIAQRAAFLDSNFRRHGSANTVYVCVRKESIGDYEPTR